MARFKNGYVVVHDNKTANKPRAFYEKQILDIR